MIEEVLPTGVPGAVTFQTPNGTIYFPAEDSVTFVCSHVYDDRRIPVSLIALFSLASLVRSNAL